MGWMKIRPIALLLKSFVNKDRLVREIPDQIDEADFHINITMSETYFAFSTYAMDYIRQE
jgi:hypothetical protein